ncbi:MAG: ankyrin repeat domain-containing protein [Cyanothece sp. SIO2G6]|nr:ankyrin repeat domain-containing protein [Cyanothece sp. SIO2G6]
MDIHQAILNKDSLAVKELIEQSIDINQLKSYFSPLSLAISEHHWEIAIILLEAGAIPTKDVLNTLVQHMDVEYNIDPNIIFSLIKAGIYIDERVEDGETLLMAAAGSGHFDIVKILVQAGADVNAVSRDGAFALLSAGTARHIDMFKYLVPFTSPELRATASLNLPSRFGRMLED